MLDLKSSGTTAAELPRTTAFTNLSMLFAGTPPIHFVRTRLGFLVSAAMRRTTVIEPFPFYIKSPYAISFVSLFFFFLLYIYINVNV